MTTEEKLKKIEELRILWKEAPPEKRKILEIRGKLLKMSLPHAHQEKIEATG